VLLRIAIIIKAEKPSRYQKEKEKNEGFTLQYTNIGDPLSYRLPNGNNLTRG